MAVEKLLQTVKCSAQHMQAVFLLDRPVWILGMLAVKKSCWKLRSPLSVLFPSISMILHALPRALSGEQGGAAALELVPVSTLSRGRDHQCVLSETYRWLCSLGSVGGLMNR